MKNNVSDYVKANRKGSRDAELEITSGWVGKHKIHKSKKSHPRKLKYKGVDKNSPYMVS